MDSLIRCPGVAALLLLVLAGCGQQSTVYSVAPDAARHDLVGTRIPDMAFGMSAHVEPAVATADGVAWHVIVSADTPAIGHDVMMTMPDGTPGREVMVLSAMLARSDKGTLVTIEIRPALGADRNAFDKTMNNQPAVAGMFRAIASEAVDAGLSHRPFEVKNISARIAIATLSMLPQIRQKMDEAARAFEQRDLDTIHNAYRTDRAGH
jgi:hypothetical protein